jgi:hypothetical protein
LLDISKNLSEQRSHEFCELVHRACGANAQDGLRFNTSRFEAQRHCAALSIGCRPRTEHSRRPAGLGRRMKLQV